jgi:hypothetical protein
MFLVLLVLGAHSWVCWWSARNHSQLQFVVSAAWLQPNLKQRCVYLSIQYDDAEKFQLTSHLLGVPREQKKIVLVILQQ